MVYEACFFSWACAPNFLEFLTPTCLNITPFSLSPFKSSFDYCSESAWYLCHDLSPSSCSCCPYNKALPVLLNFGVQPRFYHGWVQRPESGNINIYHLIFSVGQESSCFLAGWFCSRFSWGWSHIGRSAAKMASHMAGFSQAAWVLYDMVTGFPSGR